MVDTTVRRRVLQAEEDQNDGLEKETTTDTETNEVVGESNKPSKPVSEMRKSFTSQHVPVRIVACLVFFGATFLLINRLAPKTVKNHQEDVVHVVSDQDIRLSNEEAGRELLAESMVGDQIEREDHGELVENPAEMSHGLEKSHKQEADHERMLRYHNIWKMANNLVTLEQLWPEGPEVDQILEAMRTARIVNVDVLDIGYYESGTSEKWLVMLEGGLKAMMKLVWEHKGQMKPGALCNYGFEMAASEVAGFNLQRVLGMRNTPYVTGRLVDLRTEILPAATPNVAQYIIAKAGGEYCVSGQCFHCTHRHTICPRDNKLEASIAYWIPRELKLYTDGPKYMPFSTPNSDHWGIRGFNDKSYCKQLRPKFYPYENDRFYHDLFDFAVLDTLMYHYDSKHYMIHDESPAHGLTIRLDHGRSFCANDRDDLNIFMAPLIQCCTLRMKTWKTLRTLRPGDLTRKLKKFLDADPLAPVLDPDWYPAMERRLAKIKENMEKCAEHNGGFSNVLVEIETDENPT